MAITDLNDETSDIGVLWEQALDQYCRETGINIKCLPQMQWNVSTILSDQERQLKEFTDFRHNKGKVDKLRSAIARNSEIVTGAAEYLADAASAAFPPSAALLTAFTMVMRASKNVSDDYEMIVSFFDIMNSFLERVSLIQSKLPTAKAYQNTLLRVFSSVLTLCAIATKYRIDGRFIKWAKALVRGSDEKLKDAYDGLNKNISRLESATLFATLNQTIEISQDVKEVHQSVQQNIALAQQTLSISAETSRLTKEGVMIAREGAMIAMDTLALTQRQEVVGTENLALSKDIYKMMKRAHDRDAVKTPGSGKKTDAGARKSAAMSELKKLLPDVSDPVVHYMECKLGFVNNTFEWVMDEEAYRDFLDEDLRLLRVTGASGMGKTTFAYTTIERLRERYSDDPRTSVAFFFFKEEYDQLRSTRNMLISTILQAALDNTKYRGEVLTALHRSGNFFYGIEGMTRLWEQLVVPMFSQESAQRLFLVLDGVDEADEPGRAYIVEMMKTIVETDVQIHIVFTTDGGDNEAIDALQLKTVEITKEKVSNDMRRIAIARCRNLTRLRKLRPQVRRKIALRLKNKADNFLYVEHLCRRLNGIGREGAVLKELENLPANTVELYELLLAECKKHRTPDQLDALRKLFAWMAYSKEQLSYGTANRLLALLAEDHSISLEEELDGKSSRILRVTTSLAADDPEASSSDSDDTDHHDDAAENIHESVEDLNAPLNFQERSLRKYFRDMNVDNEGLRSTPASGHLAIFESIVAFLSQKEISSDYMDPEEAALTVYASSYWFAHFHEIDVDDINPEQAASAVEGLYTIISNKNSALKLITCLQEEPAVFGQDEENTEKILGTLKRWAEHVSKIPATLLPPATLDWVRQFSHSPARVYIVLARGHIKNWFFTSTHVNDARHSFLAAHDCLRRAKELPELCQNETLSQYFAGYDEKENGITAESIKIVSDAFWDIAKTSIAYTNIGRAYKAYDLRVEGLEKIRIGFQSATEDSVRFQCSLSIAEALIGLAIEDQDEESKRAKLEECLEILAATESMDPWTTLSDEDKQRVAYYDMVSDHGIFYEYRGEAQIRLGQIEEAMASMLAVNNMTGYMLRDLPELITVILEEREDWSGILDVLRHLDGGNLVLLLASETSNDKYVHDRLQRAAVETAQTDFLLEKYVKAIDLFHTHGMLSSLKDMLFRVALFCSEIIGDLPQAKDLLFRALDTGAIDHAPEIRFELVNVLLKEFRATPDRDRKRAAFDELKSFEQRVAEALGKEFNPSQSQTSIPLALMARKLGPAREFQDYLDATFRGCVEALSDSDGWNDFPSFRMLAKALACVPGLERDAQIALSCQFYVVDKSIRIEEVSDDEGGEAASAAADDQPADATAGAGDDAPDAPQMNGVDPTDATTAATDGPPTAIPTASAKPSDETQPPDVSEDQDPALPDEDLDTITVVCDSCRKEFSHWRDGPLYLCYYCVETLLCAECVELKTAREQGRAPPHWRSICGPGHKYVKGPVEGWKGCKDGVMAVGEERVAFKDWLRELEGRKWGEAWDAFWMDEAAGGS